MKDRPRRSPKPLWPEGPLLGKLNAVQPLMS